MPYLYVPAFFYLPTIGIVMFFLFCTKLIIHSSMLDSIYTQEIKNSSIGEVTFFFLNSVLEVEMTWI
jgi:hypothetical protein